MTTDAGRIAKVVAQYVQRLAGRLGPDRASDLARKGAVYRNDMARNGLLIDCPAQPREPARAPALRVGGVSFHARGGRVPAIVFTMRGFLRVLDFVTPARRLGISLEEVRQITVRNPFGIRFRES